MNLEPLSVESARIHFMQVQVDNEAQLKQQLSTQNQSFSPDKLKTIFPTYQHFSRDFDHFSIWHTTESQQKIKHSKSKFSKVLLMLSGVAGGGKDAIREKIDQLYPGSMFKVITATSRQPREDEQDKVDYYFYDSVAEFKRAINTNDFLEWVEQGKRLYGLPKKSLTDALVRPEPIIVTHVEMTAWPKVSRFMEQEVENKPLVLKIFVLPQLKYDQYTQMWLKTQRKDYEARLTRTLWELQTAPEKAELLIGNHIDNQTPFLEWSTRSLLEIIKSVLQPSVFKFRT